MNDEIKEFIEFRVDEDGTYFYYIDKNGDEQWSYNLDNLKDYITNLQQRIEGLEAENETLRNDFKNQVEYTNKIAKENERLKAIKPCMLSFQECYVVKDYKSRCEKADNQLKIIMQIIKEQPTRNVEDDEWIENRLISVVKILQNGSDSQ